MSGHFEGFCSIACMVFTLGSYVVFFTKLNFRKKSLKAVIVFINFLINETLSEISE